MGLKRTIAKTRRVVARTRAEMDMNKKRREREEIKKLTLQRNKDLSKASRYTALAQAREDALDAKRRLAKVKPESKLLKASRSALGSFARATNKIIKDVAEDYNRPPRKRRKTTSRRR